MAAKTIKNFLVGLGLDIDDKGFQQAETGFDMIGKKAMQMGAAVAGAFGAKALTFDFVDAVDSLGKFSQFLDVSADDVRAYGNALAREANGSVEQFKSQILSLAKLRAGELKGDYSYVMEANIAKVDQGALKDFREAGNAVEAFLALADAFDSTMSEKQRLNLQDAFGLDDQSVLFLMRSREEIEKIVEAQRSIRPLNDDAVDLAAEFNSQFHDFWQNIGGIADVLSVEILQELNTTLDKVNNLFDENRGTLHSSVKMLSRLQKNRAEETHDRQMDFFSNLVQGDIENAFTWDNLKSLNPISPLGDDLRQWFAPDWLKDTSHFQVVHLSPESERRLEEIAKSTPSPIPAGSAGDLNFNFMLDSNPIRAIVRDENGRQVRQTLNDVKKSAD